MNSEVQPIVKKGSSLLRGIIYLIIVLLFALGISVLLSGYVIRNAHDWGDRAFGMVEKQEQATLLSRIPAEDLDTYKTKVEKDIAAMKKKLDSNIPKQPYLIVNTANNTFRLMKYDQLIREGICSTGSYTILTAGDDQKWVFETPRGMLKVLTKEESPVWVKPDWAFVEEGLPVPPPGHRSRYEKGVLGDYKLTLGKGYMIHGTLYKRFLGLPVTHGCIRLGDDDLEAVYKNLQPGSRVYIY